jgi:tetratricopeptide (TPR) repeat protein
MVTALCPESPLLRLAPELVKYASDQFSLKDDLDHLDQVQRVGAPEAVILYCARILEVLAADALKAVKLPASANVFANLDALQQFNLIPTTTRYWAHALRRNGNQVRHINRRVQPEDAHWSVLLVERWLDWFFRQFRYGRRLPSLTKDQGPFVLNACAEARALMAAFDAVDFNPRSLLPPVRAAGEALFRTPSPPAVLAEMLLDRKEHDACREVLGAALAVFPDDLRLRQLLGLYWSRCGDLAQARRCLEPLFAQNPDDEETAGISAGVYKRLWLAARHNRKWLAKSQRAYRQGWERSKGSNAYLGINAATTALWLEQPEEARQVAAEVEELLRDRAAALARAALARQPDDPDLLFNYWDQVTLAEAQLLLGQFAAARHTYQQAFARHPEQQANIDVSRQQMGEILRALSLSVTPETFLTSEG